MVEQNLNPMNNYGEVNAEELKAIIDNKNKDEYVLLDVRTPEENQQERIPDSIHINFYDADFKEKLEKLDKEKVYYVYCRSGSRSGKTCSMMADMDFKEMYNLVGGMLDWEGEVE